MNLTQLTVFREVMETGSIAQTARKLNRTQPAISLALKNLEKTLGLTLFERKGRRLVPVPEAHYLLAETTGILDRLAAISNTMEGLIKGHSGSLNIATMPGPSAFLFPRFISQSVGENPDIKITLSTRSSPQIIELAGTQNIDFGFADFEHSNGKGPQYSVELIMADCFCAIDRENPLAVRDRISVSDLDGVPMGGLHETHPFQRKIRAQFQGASAQYNSTVTCQYFLPLIPFVSSGQCCTIVDPLTVATERELQLSGGKVVFLPIESPLRYEYAILEPVHRPPSQLALNIKAGWKSEVLAMLEDVSANPSTSIVRTEGEA
ncbi:MULTISPECIES: LysR family transcriptional regulator [unclassified Ruegeria]|uniref:LysR family transcriptional regulator n=1 Tax=unclassified Ruegeria TaxID=2625375 RepID=UPI001488DEE7|nr:MULTISPECIES: LysR family transcriptional regulator [unclassified Ruegeria]NOD35817.1 LysR family transcriptional regulator [Ruegeria sp. HKCCD7296]NOD47756.1 LysR family transcriptional regulator [Ruegeria sp. HKCCD5849]NOD52581.1 LysR family transcriptional regulator [Ruegeria sp. HKCCD5851]NOD66000.1 LysR family transcriptional regulator [Ruegeria sp. HKCCD7303]NOE34382.1 LysR family transcriptional regulator [Ruegeria sp. HKCCD7318]